MRLRPAGPSCCFLVRALFDCVKGARKLAYPCLYFIWHALIRSASFDFHDQYSAPFRKGNEMHSNSLSNKFSCNIRRYSHAFRQARNLRKNSFWLLTSCFFTLAGCGGGGETAVVAAPPVETVTLPITNGPMTSDSSGNIFVGDRSYANIIRVDGSGISTLFAGQTGVRGVADGSGSAAQFGDPRLLTTDAHGNVYVSDGSYYKPGTTVDLLPRAAIRKITPSGVVTTFAGSPHAGDLSDSASIDGVGTDARFVSPTGLAFDPAGNLFVVDGGTCIRKITPSAIVTTFAGTAGVNGIVDGVGAAARFFALGPMVSDATGNLYGIDSAGLPDVINIVIRKITPAGVVTTLASHLPNFNGKASLTINPATGTMYYSDGNGVYMITRDGLVSSAPIATATNADLTFLAPNTLAILSAGVLRKVQVEP